jgi:hypothetical protein
VDPCASFLYAAALLSSSTHIGNRYHVTSPLELLISFD